MIRYADIVKESIVDGKGIRLVVFLQGCKLACEGCHNPGLQPLDGGKEVTEEELVRLILENLNPLHKGLTISGGEPTLQAEAVHKVIQAVKKVKPNLDVWVFSGFTFDRVKDLPMMEYVDVLVDGPFRIEEKSLQLQFRGSKNQRVIDMKQSLLEDKVVPLVLEES
ncbi:anaerobic ribonucleoside-triphosphate reductase activating protein [Desulfuribacillus alkaliarsenatis]|uniref:Anaerobic ribonucleoside-triphosphate reductase-activating protein n=1 Tax=Desulfuribacillus alkaliarsenatis TaxID=766136 RepID=A0A1E5G4T3_9FIRM|nr:anaerobic ribonucleoside-triphosphate reductase activating protein [Desulfuribacillus alkaliarsenatis]OEF98187.1 anaerobic ribonucleoside-triphosphate reductase activating protein [Desulfuribacillus alkaliarsenatis]